MFFRGRTHSGEGFSSEKGIHKRAFFLRLNDRKRQSAESDRAETAAGLPRLFSARLFECWASFDYPFRYCGTQCNAPMPVRLEDYLQYAPAGLYFGGFRNVQYRRIGFLCADGVTALRGFSASARTSSAREHGKMQARNVRRHRFPQDRVRFPWGL